MFNEGFEIHPYKIKPASNYTSLITIDSNCKIKIIRKEVSENHVKIEMQNKYIDWLKNYIKYYLVANLTNDEFIKYYNEVSHQTISSKEDVIQFVNGLSFKEIITKIREVIKHGSVE